MDRTNNYNDLKPFRFWCQKVLPLVYDDSLSYYELLDKVIDYLNKTMEDVTVLNDDTEALYAAYNQLQSYVNNYFDNLDVQDEINAKLDQMAIDGTLSSLINPQIPGAVSAWLAANVNPVGSAVIVDATLSIAGAAADAQATGNALNGKQDILTFDNTPTAGSGNPVRSFGIKTYVDGSVANVVGEIADLRQDTEDEIDDLRGDVEDEITDLKGDLSDIASYEEIFRWNLIDTNKIYDGGMVDDKGNIATSFSEWSYTDYIEVKPNSVYTQFSNSGSDTEISGGVYIAQYDNSKTFISRVGGNRLTITTANNCKYVRLSVRTVGKDLLCFGIQTLRLYAPTKYFNKVAFERNSVIWNEGYAVLTSGSNIIRFNNPNWKTTEYVYLNKGIYYVTPVETGGGYITIYNNDLHPVLSTAMVSNSYGKIELNDNTFVTVSIQATQNGQIITDAEKKAVDASSIANNLNNELIGALSNKKICFYGDSITCLGNDFRETSWQGILKKYFTLNNGISVGIGGSHIKWRPNERYDLTNFVIGNNLPYGATRTTGDTGTIVSLCSWERIAKTIPSDCDIVFVMGGTNDVFASVSGSNEMSADNTTDTAWTTSSDYIGGDYDINTINGAILSIILKMHIRCPNALVIWCTPLSGRGQTSGANQLNYGTNDNTYDIVNAIMSMCNFMSCECFDLYSNSGITPYNRATYLYDTVHPNSEGMKMIARYLIEKFRNIYPRI